MHCQLLLRVMRHHGFGVVLDDRKHGSCLRKILLYAVLATDMGVHQDFMLAFKRMLEGEATSLCRRQTIICQAILKNADISNPVRHPSFFYLSFDRKPAYKDIADSSIYGFEALGKCPHARMDCTSTSRRRIPFKTNRDVFERPSQRSRITNLFYIHVCEASIGADR